MKRTVAKEVKAERERERGEVKWRRGKERGGAEGRGRRADQWQWQALGLASSTYTEHLQQQLFN